MISYRGNLAKITFTITIEDDKQRVDLYTDGEYFETAMFPPEATHKDIVGNVRANLFRTQFSGPISGSSENRVENPVEKKENTHALE